MKKGTQQLEIIQIDIQMSTIRKDNKRLKQLYEKSKSIKSAIPHPLTKGSFYRLTLSSHSVIRQLRANEKFRNNL